MDRLVLINREYTEHLVRIVQPYIYSSIDDLYRNACDIYKKACALYRAEMQDYNAAMVGWQKLRDANPKATIIDEPKEPRPVQPPLKIFQNLLRSLVGWSEATVIKETQRIRLESDASKYFDKLVRSAIKSMIMLLCDPSACPMPAAPNAPQNQSLANYHNTVKIEKFVHHCYIEAGKLTYNNPAIFCTDGIPPLDVIKNRARAYEYMGIAVREAIRRMIPMEIIVEKYLCSDMTTSSNDATHNPFPMPPMPPNHYQQQQVQHQQMQMSQPTIEVATGAGAAPFQIQLNAPGADGQGGAVLLTEGQNGGGVALQLGQGGNGLTIQTAPAQQTATAQIRSQEGKIGGIKAPRPSASFLMSQSKGAGNVQAMLAPEESQDKTVEALLDIQGGSAIDRPPAGFSDSISFDGRADSVRKFDLEKKGAGSDRKSTTKSRGK
jgi:hypothetical protein